MRLPPNEFRIITRLNVKNEKNSDILLRRCPGLRRSIIQFWFDQEAVPSQIENTIMEIDHQTTPYQDTLTRRWLEDPACPMERLWLICKTAQAKHRALAATRILEHEKLKTDAFKIDWISICGIVELCPKQREEAAALVAESMCIKYGQRDIFALRTLMWSEVAQTRAKICARCIPQFRELAHSQETKSRERANRLLNWIKIWALADISQAHMYLMPKGTPSEASINAMIQDVFPVTGLL